MLIYLYPVDKRFFHIQNLLTALKDTPKKRILLFGASKFGEKLFHELRVHYSTREIAFIDNDKSKQGKKLCNQPILSPSAIDGSRDIIAITSLSAGGAISLQLESLGLKREEDFFEVMHVQSPTHAPGVVSMFVEHAGSLNGKHVLHIGPGGNLGNEVILSLLTRNTVHSVEYHSFGLEYPIVRKGKDFYEQLNIQVQKTFQGDLFENGSLLRDTDFTRINTQSVALHMPVDVASMPFENNCFDFVFHHAVFEHVKDPARGYKEIARVLKDGGKMIGLIDPQDHRAQGAFEEFHPLSFLTLSREEWYETIKDANFHNQYTTPEHKVLMAQTNLEIVHFEVLKRMKITEELLEGFHPSFREFSRAELEILRFIVAAEKQVPLS